MSEQETSNQREDMIELLRYVNDLESVGLPPREMHSEKGTNSRKQVEIMVWDSIRAIRQKIDEDLYPNKSHPRKKHRNRRGGVMEENVPKKTVKMSAQHYGIPPGGKDGDVLVMGDSGMKWERGVDRGEEKRLKDIAVATMVLGLDIDRQERAGFSDLVDKKHVYLRLHHYLLCANPSSREAAQATWETLRTENLDSDFKPNFLPCHKRPLSPEMKPCLHPDDECHCARILGCKL